MRTIYEILLIIHKEFVDNIIKGIPHKNVYSGLCSLSINLKWNGRISFDELNLFNEYLIINKPKRLNHLCNYKLVNSFYWEIFTNRYRLQWLKKHIKLTKSN